MSTPLKISVVVVNLNLGEYLEECLKSIVGQAYANLELIVVDGGSTDNSLEIIQQYEKHLDFWVSEPDNGQYHAIQKGFDKSTGEIMAWINSDDKYLPNAFEAVSQIFNTYSEVNWLMGIAREYTQEGFLVGRITIPWSRWSKWRYYTGDFQFIQQESSFWRRGLWEKSGGKLSKKYSLAGDLELWTRFFRTDKLHTTTVELAGFRHRKENQRSKEKLGDYLLECQEILNAEKKRLPVVAKLRTLALIPVRWLLGPFFFYDIPILRRIYEFLFGLPKPISYDFFEFKFIRTRTLIKHPPMLFGKVQLHRRAFSNRA